jgi:hypothetical protein
MTTQTHTQTYRKTAIAVGILYIIATAVSLLSSALANGALDAPDYLARAGADGDRLIAGALLLIAGGVACVLIAALLFPVLRRFGEGAALGLAGIRILEAVTLFVSALSMLLLVSAGRDFAAAGGSAAAAGLVSSGSLLHALNEWAFPLNPIVFGLGGMLLYGLLYRSRLVPRWLSVWGLVGVVLVFAYGLLRMYGGGSMALAVPIGVQEMVLAGWLIVKGLDFSASRRAELPARVPASVELAGGAS